LPRFSFPLWPQTCWLVWEWLAKTWLLKMSIKPAKDITPCFHFSNYVLVVRKVTLCVGARWKLIDGLKLGDFNFYGRSNILDFGGAWGFFIWLVTILHGESCRGLITLDSLQPRATFNIRVYNLEIFKCHIISFAFVLSLV
jgi:hypothetical protein